MGNTSGRRTPRPLPAVYGRPTGWRLVLSAADLDTPTVPVTLEARQLPPLGPYAPDPTVALAAVATGARPMPVWPPADYATQGSPLDRVGGAEAALRRNGNARTAGANGSNGWGWPVGACRPSAWSFHQWDLRVAEL